MELVALRPRPLSNSSDDNYKEKHAGEILACFFVEKSFASGNRTDA
jgi:hypothetical protein